MKKNANRCMQDDGLRPRLMLVLDKEEDNELVERDSGFLN